MEKLNKKKGKKERAELQLPILHFIAMDDWLDKLGHKAFNGWLKLYTLCDRSEDREDKENDVVTWAIEKLMEEVFGVKSRTTFNMVYLKPLFEHGLIGFKEYKTKSGKVAQNIIVYPYPQNNRDLQFQPLEKVNDWNEKSQYVVHGKKGGHKSQQVKKVEEKTEIVGSKNLEGNGSKKLEGIGVQKIRPINVSNPSSINVSNSINNVSNTLSILEEKIEALNIPDSIKEVLKEFKDRLIVDHINLSHILFVYRANKKKVDEHEFASILYQVLKYTRKPIESIRALLNRAIVDELSAPVADPQSKKKGGFRKIIRKETLPDWFGNEFQPEEESDEVKREKEKLARELKELDRELKERVV